MKGWLEIDGVAVGVMEEGGGTCKEKGENVCEKMFVTWTF